MNLAPAFKKLSTVPLDIDFTFCYTIFVGGRKNKSMSDGKQERKPMYQCSICFNKFSGFGNNVEPINEGRCCDKCNDLVIVARLNRSREMYA